MLIKLGEGVRPIPLFLVLISTMGMIAPFAGVPSGSVGVTCGGSSGVLGQSYFESDSSWQRIADISDKDGNGLSDSLEARIIESDQPTTKEERTPLSIEDILSGKPIERQQEEDTLNLCSLPVIVSFPPGEIDAVISLFEDLGGNVKSIYTSAINGFSGNIAVGALKAFCAQLRENDVPFMVEEDGIAKAQLYYASRNMNLRPLTWTTYGVKGDPQTSIAVIDSGIDDSHSAFAPGYSSMNPAYKITGWRDEVSGLTSPYDNNGHGSHCAGIIGGSGTFSIDASSRTVATYGWGFNYGGYYLYDSTVDVVAACFNVTQTGTIEIQCQFDDYTPGVDAVYIWAYLYRNETVVDSYTISSSSWTDTLTYVVTTGNLGEYSLRLRVDFYGYDGYCDDPYMRFRGIIHWPFDASSMSTPNLWQGVAPDSRLVGIKVLDGEGSGTISDIVDGVNWAINNRLTYNITVISMSLGGSSGVTSLISAVNNAVNNGIVTVVSAGNDGPVGNNVGSPGDADNVITVAAMSDIDRVTEYSSQGGSSYTGSTTKPDIMAPGGSDYDFSMFSVDSNDNDAEGYFTEGYANDLAPMIGTSMAAPAVAGAASLVIDALGGRQNWHYSASEAKFVKALLLMTATETYPLIREGFTAMYSPALDRGAKDVHEGYGRINVDAAIEACSNDAFSTGQQSAFLASSSVMASEKHAMASHASLIAGIPYVISLEVPDGADFDLHVYSGVANGIGEPVQVASSVSTVLGHDETVLFTPSTSGVYYIVGKAISGSGNAILSVQGNDYAPALTSPVVTPGSGNQMAPFNFSVVYADADNNCPFSIYVNVSGVVQALNKRVPEDTNYSDGCIYEKITYLQPGSYNYYFSCFDGRFWNSTAPLSGPSVSSFAGTQAPSLNNLTLSPTQGTNVTIFEFSVIYEDPDNNFPSFIHLTINGTIHTMVGTDPTDLNAKDGKRYEFTTTLAWGTYRYRVNCSDGVFLVNTSWNEGPVVEPFIGLGQNMILFSDDFESGTSKWVEMTNPWHLTGAGSVWSNPYHSLYHSMWCGSEATGQYTNYLAAELVSIPFDLSSIKQARLDFYHWMQTEPGYDTGYISIRRNSTSSWVTLNGWSGSVSPWQPLSYDLTPYCGAGSNAVQLRFYFSSDYSVTARGWYIDDVLVTGSNLPALTTPTNGSNVAAGNVTFGWTSLDQSFEGVHYRWQLSSNSSFTAIVDEVGGITEATGTTNYTRNVTRTPGIYYWRVRGEVAGYFSNWSAVGYFLLSYQPTLTAALLSPASGNPLTSFNYSVTYTDADNNAPTYVRVYIDGSYYTMSKQNTGDVIYTDGCTYVYSRILAPGSHTYYFRASDGIFTITTTSTSGPTVTNTAPALTAGSVSPGSGIPTTMFNYSVVYTDAENMAPSYIRVYIDGGYYTMSKQNAGDVTYTDGCTYVYSRTLAPGTHNYYFSTSDGYLSNTTTTTSGPTVTNTAPALTAGSVSPGSGFPTTPFTYSVVYTDAENMEPSYVRVYIDSTYYTMSKLNGSDVTYTDGCTYVYSRTLAPGTHNYYFSTSDGYLSNTTTTTSGPTVTNTAPALTAGSVSPGSGFPTTVFTYSVVYTDAENMAPSYIRVYIDGSYSTMSKQNASDVTYTDGCTYVYSRALAPGTHNYYFYTNDGYLSFTTTTTSGPTVTNTAPALTSGVVSPSDGVPSTLFTYSVVYTDAENMAPSYIRVYIDGGYYTMSKQNAGDVTYADGCTYVYSCILTPTSHDYYFSTSDGYLTTSTSSISGPTVINHAPTLTSGSLTPSSAQYSEARNKEFIYTVTYTDADNDAPSWIIVYIDGESMYMSQQDYTDVNYADGCVFQFILNTYYYTSFSIGDHTFSFSASDGYATGSTDTFTGPQITRYSDSQITGFVIFACVMVGLLFFGITMAKVAKKKNLSKAPPRLRSVPSSYSYGRDLYPPSPSPYGQYRPPAQRYYPTIVTPYKTTPLASLPPATSAPETKPEPLHRASSPGTSGTSIPEPKPTEELGLNFVLQDPSSKTNPALHPSTNYGAIAGGVDASLSGVSSNERVDSSAITADDESIVQARNHPVPEASYSAGVPLDPSSVLPDVGNSPIIPADATGVAPDASGPAPKAGASIEPLEAELLRDLNGLVQPHNSIGTTAAEGAEMARDVSPDAQVPAVPQGLQDGVEPPRSALELVSLTCECCTNATGSRVEYHNMNISFCPRCGTSLAYLYHCSACSSDINVPRDQYPRINGIKFCPRCGAP